MTVIPYSGCRNLRDLGGLLNRAGSQVAPGRLFRGAAPTSPSGLYEALGIRRVIDLRADSERETETDALAPGVELVHIPLLEDLAPWSVPFERTPPNVGRRYFEMLTQGAPAFVRIVELLGSADLKPTLVHCVSGRDRTGIVIGCVLALLGVPDDTIAADYALSSEMDDREGRNASPENLLWLLRAIRERHGDVRGMASDIGVSEAALEALARALLLTTKSSRATMS